MKPPSSPTPAVRKQGKQASARLVKFIDGHWCWREIGTGVYRPAPELEAKLLAARGDNQT